MLWTFAGNPSRLDTKTPVSSKRNRRAGGSAQQVAEGLTAAGHRAARGSPEPLSDRDLQTASTTLDQALVHVLKKACDAAGTATGSPTVVVGSDLVLVESLKELHNRRERLLSSCLHACDSMRKAKDW